MKTIWTTAWLTGLLLCGIQAPALADRRTSLEEAVSQARERYPGRVISAETHRSNGQEAHRIRILTDEGRVKRLVVDPKSGRFGRGKPR